MDEDKRYTLQIKGTAYKFKPLDLNELSKVELLDYMEVSDGVRVRAVMRLLRTSLDAAVWDELATRFVNGDVPLEELSSILERLVKKTVKDAEAAKAANVSNDD